MAFGLTDEGFVIKRLPVIKEEIEIILRDKWPNLNLSEETPEGEFIGVFSERAAFIWELAELVYNSFYPSTSNNTGLDGVSQITGTTRLAAKNSTVAVEALFGTIGTVIPQGTQISIIDSPASIFETDEEKTLVAGADEIQKITPSAVPTSGNFKLTYIRTGAVTPDIPFSADAAAIQTALRALKGLTDIIVSGTFALWTITFPGADGKQPQPLLVISDNTLSDGGAISMPVTQDTLGIYQASVSMTALLTGPTQALFGTLTEIVNPISGLDSVKNTEADGVLGRNIETDAELRLRREKEVEQAGAATVETIRAGLLDVDNVTQAIVFENDSLVTDINGLPPKSMKCFVDGGDDQEIADKIWDKKGGGIKFVGDITKQVEDSQGIVHDVPFSRPTDKDIFVIIDIIGDSTYGGNIAVIAQVLAYGATLSVGSDAIAHGSAGLETFVSQVAGITDISIKWGFAPVPTVDDNLIISINELAKFDSSRIIVNS